MKKSIAHVDRQWSAIRFTLAMFNDFRFPFTYTRKRGCGLRAELVGVVKREEQSHELHEIRDHQTESH